MCGGCFCLFSNAFSISHDIEELIEKTCEKESLFSNTFSIVTVIEKVVENERLRLKAFRPFPKKVCNKHHKTVDNSSMLLYTVCG